ncbi:hypothetical protein [Acetobacter sp. DsW_063]|uniref:hypothetical protein n=1 Tax=Acetobacter sp. DsW_063 TaxID=1514894 RepID=UPI000A36692F|nr:hypothetical protein [Acetobacter sp. DsW_063]OUJ16481.1 hypothetical protein HK28_12435 [Acetobacter sp. DsW_063]
MSDLIGMATAANPLPPEVITHLVRQHDSDLKEQSRQIERLSTRMDDMGGDIKVIKAMMEAREKREHQRDGAIKLTVWVANTLGTGGLFAVAAALYKLFWPHQ